MPRESLVRFVFSLAAAACTLAAGRADAGAQAPAAAATPKTATQLHLLGVYDSDSGDPLAGVRVTDVLSGLAVETGTSGTVSLRALPEGVHLIRVQKVGYEVQTMPVSISQTDTAGVTLLLRRVTQLEAVVTRDSAIAQPSIRLRGFEERRKTGIGYFITSEQLRKDDGRPLANVLTARAPGIAIDRRKGSRSLLVKSPRCIDGTSAGPPAVYLDGVRVASTISATSTSIDLQDFSVSDLAGVEWYPSSSMMPIEFDHTSSACGALLLWTRDR